MKNGFELLDVETLELESVVRYEKTKISCE